MSHECTTWAWRQVEKCEKSSFFLVLLKLADMAHVDGKSWPSHAYLAKQTGLSERTVRSAIASLEASELVQTEPRPGKTDVIFLLLTSIVLEPTTTEEMELGTRGRPRKTPANSEKPRQIMSITPARFADEPVIEPVNRNLSSSPKADVIPFDKTEWGKRFEEAKEVAGDAADLTRPAMHHARDLRLLVEPSSGEPCQWEEVLDAIRVVSARQRARGKTIQTWKWIEADALAMRDKRLSGLREVDRSVQAPISRGSSFADQDADVKRQAWALAKSRMENGNA